MGEDCDDGVRSLWHSCLHSLLYEHGQGGQPLVIDHYHDHGYDHHHLITTMIMAMITITITTFIIGIALILINIRLRTQVFANIFKWVYRSVHGCLARRKAAAKYVIDGYDIIMIVI